MIKIQEYNIIYKYIYNYTEFILNIIDDDKQSFKNELYILSKMFDLGMVIKYDPTKYNNTKICEIYIKWVKDMMSRYIPRKED